MSRDVRVSYRDYKTRYKGYKSVPGSYDAERKTINIVVPDECQSNFGNRYELKPFYCLFDGPTGKYVISCFAKTGSNALRKSKSIERSLEERFSVTLLGGVLPEIYHSWPRMQNVIDIYHDDWRSGAIIDSRLFDQVAVY